jgi:hypothetical protein
MQSFTHHGFGPDPGRYTVPEPIFPLSRKRPHGRRPPSGEARSIDSRPYDLRAPLPRAWPFEHELTWATEDDVDFDEPVVAPRTTTRSIVTRLVGSLVLIAAFFGCGTVLSRPEVRNQILDWATLGHADGARAAVRSAIQGR